VKRWFCANLEGSYVGTGPRAAAGPARRYRLQVYRAVLRDLAWIDAPNEQAAAPIAQSEASPTLSQAQVDQAHVAGVRGPGTWYEGPIFDVRVSSVQLTHPTENKGRAYGRILGSAIGWLELPPPPEPPPVVVSEVDAEAKADPPPVLHGVVYSASPLELASAVDEPATDASGPARVPASSQTTGSAHGVGLLPLVALTTLVGLGLFVACGALSLGLWALFMLPTLVARKLFVGVLGDSVFVRGVGYGLIAVQWSCVSPLLSHAWQSGCPELQLLPLLGAVAVLFPAGLLSSATPITCTAVGLALVLATLCRGPASECAAHAKLRDSSRYEATASAPSARAQGWCEQGS
jgi:hypothetical protein